MWSRGFLRSVWSMVLISVVLALLAAGTLAVGTHLQHHAIRSRDTDDAGVPSSARGGSELLVLQPLWLLGLGLLVLETVLNVAALGLGPVALVQPIGTVSLVIAVLISVRVFGRRVTAPLVGSIALTLISVVGFVGISARYASTGPLLPGSLAWLNGMLLLASVVGAVLAATRAGHLVLVGVAGLAFGTVAASAHVVTTSVIATVRAGTGVAGVVDLLAHGVPITLVGMAVASAVGMWAVQVAYTSGPPETVLAGLTVLDPMMAVTIGALVLGEYRGLTGVAALGLFVTGAAAVAGVLLLARFHPCGQERPVVRTEVRRTATSHGDEGPVQVEPGAVDAAETGVLTLHAARSI